jgi:hypothetical protein
MDTGIVIPAIQYLTGRVGDFVLVLQRARFGENDGLLIAVACRERDHGLT